MAIFHLQAKVIQRSKGQSVIAAAAYRAAAALYDAELGRTQNFLAKAGVIHSEILLPAGAPRRWLDRETLWNEVVAGERRKDASLAREIELSLPRELSQAEAIRLAQDYVREQFVARGMVADLNVHWGKAGDGEAQPHAHVLLTMRRIDPLGGRGERANGGRAARGRDPERGAGRAHDIAADPGAAAGAGAGPDRGDHRGAGGDPGDAAENPDPAGHHRPEADGAAGRRLIAAARLREGLRRHGMARPDEAAGFGLKELSWNDKALLRTWRERWAELVNARLAELGHDVRIDHRSNAARALDLEPQNKIGPAGARRAARGEDAERADEHRAIARRNGERLLAEPALALKALTQQQSTFSRHDLARLINRQSDGAEQFAAIMAKVEASPELVRVGADGRGRDRFSTRELVRIERELIATAVALNQRTTHRVESKRRRAVVDVKRLSEEQELAYQHVTRARDLAVVVGIAGGGKSSMLGTAREDWTAQGYRVRGAALSGIAAEGLEGSAGIESRTIASWEYAWQQGKERLTCEDILVVDEAGMIGSRQLGRLTEQVHAAGAKLVLVGDAEQLQAIEAGAAFRAIADRVGVIAITEPRRQRIDWQRTATKELASGRTAAALDRYADAGMVHRHTTREAACAAVIARWDRARRQDPAHSQIILAHERADVRALNEAARAVRRAAGELGPDHALATERGTRAFATGDRLYFLRNERGLGVKNGTLGTLERIEGSRLTVRLDGPGGAGAAGAAAGGNGAGPSGAGQGRAVSFDLAEYADIDHGYAATVHKNQGATVDQAHVLATAGMDRHLVYVALSRHRHAVHLHWGADEFGTAARLRALLGRERAKDTTLDYAEPEVDPVVAYAEWRGLTPFMPASEIVVLAEPAPALEPTAAERPEAAADSDAALRQEIAAGVARARAEFAEHRSKQAARAETPAPDAPAPVPPPAVAPAAGEAKPAAAPAGAFLVRPGSLLEGALASSGTPAAKPSGTAAMTPMAAELAAFKAKLANCSSRVWAPLMSGLPYQPVSAAEIALEVNGDLAVRQARLALMLSLGRVYRDSRKAEQRLKDLLRTTGDIAAVAAAFRRDGPEILGKLRGREGLFASADLADERRRAREGAVVVGECLDARGLAERRAANDYRSAEEQRRQAAAIEVPDLSERGRLAVEAVAKAGAAGSQLAPWPPAAPSADDIARAARVAPFWDVIKADPDLHSELQGFMQAARQRLPSASLHLSSAMEAFTFSSILAAAQNLHGSHPRFQAYAAAEPERRAQAAREAEQRAAAARHELERAAEEERRLAAKQAEIEKTFNEWRKRRRPSPGPGMG